MNTIYGANSKSKFLELQKLNSGKVKKNNSMLLLRDDLFDIYKVHVLAEDFKFPRKKYNTFLGISEKRTKEFDSDSMNPLITNKWIVSCIGDVTNKKDVIEDFSGSLSDPTLNSRVLFALLNFVYQQTEGSDVHIIEQAVSLMEGRYAMWIHDLDSRNTFLFKCNADLYADIYENTFSTTKFEGSEPLEDGELYLLTKEGITNVASCDCSIN
jgi:hypothetical protein